MDLFYTAEWMARQDQDHSLPMQKKLKLKPVEEDGTVFKMFDGDTEKALIDLHDRNPGEVFKARIRDNGNTFNENRKELGSIRAESFFSDNYRVELPEDFPFSLILFLSCLALCDSESPMMPVYNSYWYYG